VGPIERKGSEDLAKSSAIAVDQSNLGQAPSILILHKVADYGFRGRGRRGREFFQ